MKTTCPTIAHDPREPDGSPMRITPLQVGVRVQFRYFAAGQDGLDDHAVCRLANQQEVAIYCGHLTNDDGSPVNWKEAA